MMRSQNEFHLNLVSAPNRGIAEKAFNTVWRFDFTAPGFCLLDCGPATDSRTLRSWMVELKELLSEIGAHRGNKPFIFRSMGRFDQQETTKFHVDGAPEQSLLLLGYEPSKVRSRLFLADYTHAAYDLKITPKQFLQDFNPMYRQGAELLGRYITELPQPADGRARILLINNSLLPFTEDRSNPLGVMHKAEVANPTQAERRLVNSMMLGAEGEEISKDRQEEFVQTDEISKKIEYLLANESAAKYRSTT